MTHPVENDTRIWSRTRCRNTLKAERIRACANITGTVMRFKLEKGDAKKNAEEGVAKWA
jgi:hypothetical protein